MGLKLFNTLSRSVQEFIPLNPDGKGVEQLQAHRRTR